MKSALKRLNPDFNAAARSELTLLDWKFQAAVTEALHDDPAQAAPARQEAFRISDQYRDLFFRQFRSLDDFEKYLDTADPAEMTLEHVYAETMRSVHRGEINPFLDPGYPLPPGTDKLKIEAEYQANFVAPYRSFLKKLTPIP